MIDVSPAIALVLTAGVLVGTGVYLLLERSLSRVIVGLILLGNGVNLIFLVMGGRAGGPPLYGTTETEDMADPLPQAMVLTAIVITLGLSAFVLAMAYRSWQLHGHDEVQDDLEDRRVADRLARAELADRADEGAVDLDVEAAEARDETEEEPPPSIDDPEAAAEADAERHGEAADGEPAGTDDGDEPPAPSEDDPAEQAPGDSSHDIDPVGGDRS